jgi:hypothetical protein
MKRSSAQLRARGMGALTGREREGLAHGNGNIRRALVGDEHHHTGNMKRPLRCYTATQPSNAPSQHHITHRHFSAPSNPLQNICKLSSTPPARNNHPRQHNTRLRRSLYIEHHGSVIENVGSGPRIRRRWRCASAGKRRLRIQLLLPRNNADLSYRTPTSSTMPKPSTSPRSHS